MTSLLGTVLQGAPQRFSSRRPSEDSWPRRPAVQLSAFMKSGAVTPSVVSATCVNLGQGWRRVGAWPSGLVMFVVGVGCTELGGIGHRNRGAWVGGTPVKPTAVSGTQQDGTCAFKWTLGPLLRSRPAPRRSGGPGVQGTAQPRQGHRWDKLRCSARAGAGGWRTAASGLPLGGPQSPCLQPSRPPPHHEGCGVCNSPPPH